MTTDQKKRPAMTITPDPPLGEPLARPRPRARPDPGPPSLRGSRGRLFAAAVNRLDVTVHVERDETLTLGRGGPAMTVRRPDEFFARLGRHALIGFGEAYLTGAWDTERPEDLAAFLTVLAAELPHPGARAAAERCAPSSSQAAAPRAEQHQELAGQHRPPLRPLQRAVRAVPRPDR